MGNHYRLILCLVLVLAVLSPGRLAVAGGSDEEKEAVAAFKKAMKAKGERARIRAVNEIAEVEGKSVSKELKKVVGSDRSEQVRAAAARALGKRGDPKDLGYLVAATKRLKKLPIALAGAIDGIAEFGDRRTAEELFGIGRYWMAKHKYPSLAVIRGLGKIRARESITYLIKLYEITYPSGGYLGGPNRDPSLPGPTSDDTSAALSAYRPYIEASLGRLTGESIGEIDIWKEWWDENERSFDPASVKEDVNRTLSLTDAEFRYRITRPDVSWTWAEKPEKGFDRTAGLEVEGRIEARLSVLAYSTIFRTPAVADEMLERQKKALLERLTRVKEQKWDEEVEVDGVKAVRQTIEGSGKKESVEIQQTILVHREIMYVIRVTTDRLALRETTRSAEKFYESFRFLE